MITTQCPHCGARLQVEEKYVGKRGRCVKCKQVFIVPEPLKPTISSPFEPPLFAEDVSGEPDRPPAQRGVFDDSPVAEPPPLPNPFSTPSAFSEPDVDNPFAARTGSTGATYPVESSMGELPWVSSPAPSAPSALPPTPPLPAPPAAARPGSPPARDTATGRAGQAHPFDQPEPAVELVGPSPTPVVAPRPLPADRPTAVPLTPPQSDPALRQVETAASRPPILSAANLGNLRLDAIDAFLVNLPCKNTFVLAGGTYASAGKPTPRVLVRAVGSNGVVGWGEVTPCPTWCYETSESILSTIRSYLAPTVRGLPAWDFDRVMSAMDRAIQPGATIGQPLAKSGIDTAIHDMLARSLEVPLYVLLGSKRIDEIWLSYIVSAATPDEAVNQLQQGLKLGYSAFKIKVGMHNETIDRRIIRAVAEQAPKGTFLWVDANQGYRLDAAIRQAKLLGKLGVQAFEQPLMGSQINAFHRLVRLNQVPIAIDETLGTPADLIEYIRHDAVDLPIAKVQRCGGHWNAKQFCAIADAAGLRTMGSGLCETDLGLAHGLQLFCAFGIDLPCDLNGRQFVESVFVRETVSIRNGRVAIPDRPGCGVEVDEDKVRQFAVNTEDVP